VVDTALNSKQEPSWHQCVHRTSTTLAVLADSRFLSRSAKCSVSRLYRCDVAQPRMGSLAKAKAGEMPHVPFSAAVLGCFSKATWAVLEVQACVMPYSLYCACIRSEELPIALMYPRSPCDIPSRRLQSCPSRANA
jgi:hypothetical protein